jgi:hypothetical protein
VSWSGHIKPCLAGVLALFLSVHDVLFGGRLGTLYCTLESVLKILRCVHLSGLFGIILQTLGGVCMTCSFRCHPVDIMDFPYNVPVWRAYGASI